MANLFVEDRFIGGIADGSKVGYRHAYNNGIGLDFKLDPDKVTALKSLKKDSSTVVTDLIKWMVEDQSNIWMYGDSGKIYKRDSAGTYSLEKTVTNSNGQGIEVFNDELWYANVDTIGKATDISGTIEFEDGYFDTLSTDITASGDAAAPNNYAIPTTISETSTNKRSWTATTNNIRSILIQAKTINSVDWTLIIHDSLDNEIAREEIVSANLVDNKITNFEFGGAPTLIVGDTYHFHVIASGTGATLGVTTTNDLSTAEFYARDFFNGNIDQSRTFTDRYQPGQYTYTLKNQLNEDESDKIEFTPLKGSLSAISLFVFFKGSLDWNIEIHDSLDRVIGTSSLTNATFPSSRGIIKFSFSSPLELNVGSDYHIHVFTPGGSTTNELVVTGTASDLNTAGFYSHFPVLENDDNYHMMKTFLNKLCIGNGRYLATVDDSEIYDNQALVFPKGEKVRSIETIGDYLAISTWKGTDLSDYGSGRMYLWDGISSTFNAFLDLDGQIHTMKNSGNNILEIIHGTIGQLTAYSGGLTELRKLKGLEETKTVEILPGAITTWEGVLYFGIGGGTSANIDRVIWGYGRRDKDYPRSLTKDYVISTGSKDSDVVIGSVLGVSNDKFLVGWKDDVNYGVDIIDPLNDQDEVFIESLRFDNKKPLLEKQSKTVSMRFEELTVGQSIEIYTRVDNKGSFIKLGEVNYTDENDRGITYKSFSFTDRFFEFEYKVVLKTTGTDSPTLLSVGIVFDQLSEAQIGRAG